MDKKDYEEPRCPMDNSMWVQKKVTPIPTDRITAREDEYLGRNDYAGALRHLLYWWGEAEQGNDDRGKLLLCNELMGLHRKMGSGDKAKEYAQKALKLVAELGLADTIGGATAYLNSGTVYKAFDEPERSLEYFQKAREVYERELEPDSERKAGLYNNMALTLTDLGRYDEAMDLYRAALKIIHKTGKADEAITWLNMADCASAQKGMEAAEEEIQEYLGRAQAILDGVDVATRDGYYAFVCDKCAPTFGYYGWFLAAKKYREIAEKIYAK